MDRKERGIVAQRGFRTEITSVQFLCALLLVHDRGPVYISAIDRGIYHGGLGDSKFSILGKGLEVGMSRSLRGQTARKSLH